MKTKSIANVLFGLTLSAAALSSFAAAPSTPTKLLGDTAPVAAAERTITITPDTKYINVVGGQTVKFDANGKTFAWTFDGASNVSSFDLSRVAPEGTLDHPVTAYVSLNPEFAG